MPARDSVTRPAASGLVLVISLLVTFALLGLGLAVIAGADDDTRSGAAPDPRLAEQTDRQAASVALLRRQQSAVRRDAPRAYAATWAAADAAQRRARAVYVNLEELGVDRFSPRLLANTLGGVSVERRPDFGVDAWTADVEVSWRIGGFDRRPATSTVTYTFVEGAAGRASVAEISGSSSGRDPVWLVDGLDVVRRSHTLAVATTGSAARQLSSDLVRAVRQVRTVLPDWRGGVAALWPGSTVQMEAVLGSAPAASVGIAAVSASVDGSGDPRSPVAIVLNPRVFATIGPIARQVVIAHEAAHVASGAVTVDMPLWVAEGFADYVGLAAVDVPLSVSARLALRQVREQGAPASLPSDRQFATDARTLPASYELAWLAARLIAREYGEPRLVAFHRAVVDAPDELAAAFDEVLGVSEAEFTRDWQAHLTGLAGGG